MPAAKQAATLDNLRENVAAIFEQAQVSLANHRKNTVALYKLHTQAAKITQSVRNGSAVKLVGEKIFGDVMVDMINRVLVVKKGPAAADRVVKFVGAYIKFVNEKVISEKLSSSKTNGNVEQALDDEEEEEETFATRFVSRLLTWLFQGFSAKNKNIRYRSVCIIAEMIAHLGEIDEDTYSALRDGLVDRVCDKEALVRAPAAIALSKLVGTEDPDEVKDGERTVLDVLLEVLRYDPAAEVRRAALMNVPLNPNTFESVLSRTRDVDPVLRKLVYTGALQPKLGHPRQLTIAQREQVVKDGLGDREPAVRVATGKMVAGWFDLVCASGGAADNKEGEGEGEGAGGKAGEGDDGGDGVDEMGWQGDDGGVMKGLVRFLSLFDVVGPGEAVAVDAMLSILVTRPEIAEVFVFEDGYWTRLTPESAVLARVFVDHCRQSGNEARLEAAGLPVVTAFAFHLQESYNVLLGILQQIENIRLLGGGAGAGEGQGDEDEEERLEEELAKREVVLSELLKIAVTLDYMDEIGRRKFFVVIKEMLGHPELPPGLIERCLDVLRAIVPSERELIRVVVEIVIELREDETQDEAPDVDDATIDGSVADTTVSVSRKDKSLRRAKDVKDMSTEERIKVDMTDMRCLLLCIGMLERVDGTFEDNSTLEGILADLIIPAVKRKELPMREKGLVSLGLCCLIAKPMALSSFQLFVSQVQSAPEELQLQVMRVIFDLLIVYDQEFFGKSEDTTNRITSFLLQVLDGTESSEVQAVVCIGISKLLLSGIITDTKVLTSLVVSYITPITTNNLELRQCLSYFFPVYCYSSPANQQRMESIFISTYDIVIKMHEQLEEDQEMISPYQFGLLMVDWTDQQKAAEGVGAGGTIGCPHSELAIDIMAGLYDSERDDEDKKTLCLLLGHLNIPPNANTLSILKLSILVEYLEQQCPFDNPVLEKSFQRFKVKFEKSFAGTVQRVDPALYDEGSVKEVYEFIGVDVPEAAERPTLRVDDLVEPERNGVLVNGEEDSRAASEEEVEEDDERGSSRSSSPTPKSRTTKKDPKPQPKKKSRGSLTTSQTPSPPQNQSRSRSPSGSSEDEAQPEKIATPKKQGIKRQGPPGSGSITSPAVRKRNRLRSPRSRKDAKARFASPEVMSTKRSHATRSEDEDQVDDDPDEEETAEALLMNDEVSSEESSSD